MASIGQIRGALLEEAVLYLLHKVGYRVIYRAADSSELTGIRDGHSGLELRGRGTWHQIDALAECDVSPAFMYPLRLILEAKFYTNTKIQLGAIRSFFGVEKDISENYFTKRVGGSDFSERRFNYRAAMLSVYGYTSGAVEFAVAHQIFLIEYKNIPVIAPVIDAIAAFGDNCITAPGKDSLAEVRAVMRNALQLRAMPLTTPTYLTERGLLLINDVLAQSVRRIGGSYFGMLQGRWPIHFLTETEISPEAAATDVIQCRLSGNDQGQWGFYPIDVQEGSPRWFRLQFSLPPELASRISARWDDPVAVATEKTRNFSFVNLSGIIGGIRRTIRLEMSREWLDQYLARIRP
jgi:hypothetical protein